VQSRTLTKVAATLVIMLAIGIVWFAVACGEEATTTTGATTATTVATTEAPTSTETSAVTSETTETTSPAQAEYKLLFATYSSENGFGSAGLQAFGKDLEEKTNGRVKVEYSYSQALGKIPQYYDILINGTADVVFFSPYQTTGMFPLCEVGTLPFIQPNAVTGSKAFAEVYRAGLLDERVYKDFKALFVCGDGGSNLRNNKRPVIELADAKGLKIMIPGGEITSARVKAMGAVPVVITGTDVYPALQKGTIDGQLTGWAPMIQFKWCEVNKYATEPLIGGSPWIVGMNWDSYNRLPEDIRKIIDEMAQDDKYMLAAAEQVDKMNETSRNCFLEHGGKIDQWSSSALEQLGKNMVGVWDKWIKDNEAKGLKARDLVDAYYHALEQLGVTNPGVGYTPSK